MRLILVACWLLTGCALAPGSRSSSELEQQLGAASDVIHSFHAIPERGIPPALLERAYAIAVIPDMIKAGFVVAGKHGRGVISTRTATGWSSPAFIKLTGGSVGWQAGVQAADLVLVFTNAKGVENLSSGKFTLGADASVAAGPLGRTTSASTDHEFKAEVYSYSRARGLFAGVSLQGAALRMDHDANATFYVQPGISPDDIFAGTMATQPTRVGDFRQALAAALAVNRIQVPAAPADGATSENTASDIAEETAPAPVRTYAIGERAADESEQSE